MRVHGIKQPTESGLNDISRFTTESHTPPEISIQNNAISYARLFEW